MIVFRMKKLNDSEMDDKQGKVNIKLIFHNLGHCLYLFKYKWCHHRVYTHLMCSQTLSEHVRRPIMTLPGML